MTTATKDLENDHVHILHLIDVMEKMASLDTVNVSDAEEVVDLIRNFADGLHHAKEESLLFPKMVEKGYSLQTGPVAVMLQDHEQGRVFVKGMVEGILQYKSGNKESLPTIFENMMGYAQLLRHHIAKENNVLFRMADNVLSDNEQQVLLSEFERLARDVESDMFTARIVMLASGYQVK